MELQQIDERIEEQIETKLFAPIRKVWEFSVVLVLRFLCMCVHVCEDFCICNQHTSFTLRSSLKCFALSFPFHVSHLLSPPHPHPPQALDERKAQLIAEAHEICQQRIKSIEQQQMDLAIKSTLVEEALSKGERVCAANVSRSPAAGESIICLCTCLFFVYLCMHANGGHISNGLPLLFLDY